MPIDEFTSFPEEVARELKTYVYRLIDPRNGETFYVGRGKGNRVFALARAEVSSDEDDLDDKLQRIREIRMAGFQVLHVIHRHGLDDATAAEVEGALIDAYPGLTNVVGGEGSGDYGVMHALEIVRRYKAEPATFKHKALLIHVNRSSLEASSLYEAVRFAWRIDLSKATQADVVLAVHQGVIVGAFTVDQWLPATEENFPGRKSVPGRVGFVGREAPPSIGDLYLGKAIPETQRKRGAVNPVRYTW